MNHLFSTGMPRSGTNVVTKALSVHNDIMVSCGPNIEIYRFLRDALVRRYGSKALQQHVKPRCPIQDYYGEEHRIELLDLVLNASLEEKFDEGEWEEFHQLAVTRVDHDSSDLLPGYSSLKGDNYLEIVSKLAHLIGELRGAGNSKYIGIHESWHIDSLPALARAFPQAKFIVMLRDPRGSINSLLGQAAERPEIRAQVISYARHFRKYIVLTHKFKRAPLFKDRLRVIRYEDTMANPALVMEETCHFIGVDYDERMIDTKQYLDFSTGSVWKGNSAFDKIVTGFDLQRSMRWKKTLSVETIAAIEFLCANEMKIAGYAPDNEINTDPVQVMNYLIHEDFRTPVKWRTDIGDPTLDLSLELLRHTLLRSKTKLVDSMVLRRCFLFEEFCNPDIEPLFPLKAT